MTLAAPVQAHPGSAELRRGATSVRVAVTCGAPVTSCAIDGHEWCGGGAWSEYAPTEGGCVLPSFIAGAPRSAFPEGGLLASEEPVVEVHADGGAGTITARWPVTTYPLAWTRVVSIESDGAVRLAYSVTSAHRAPLPFVWGLGLPLPWSNASGVDVPKGARARVSASFGDGLPAAGSEFAWPALRDGGTLADLSHPASVAARKGVRCYVELSRGRLVLHDAGASLAITGDERMVTHAHVWANHDADTPAAEPRHWWKRRSVARVIAAGPAIGAPGLLTDAVGGWHAARWIEPGETMQWTIRCASFVPPST